MSEATATGEALNRDPRDLAKWFRDVPAEDPLVCRIYTDEAGAITEMEMLPNGSKPKTMVTEVQERVSVVDAYYQEK